MSIRVSESRLAAVENWGGTLFPRHSTAALAAVARRRCDLATCRPLRRRVVAQPWVRGRHPTRSLALSTDGMSAGCEEAGWALRWRMEVRPPAC